MKKAAENTADDYVTRVHEDPLTIDADAWDALLERQPNPTPFMSAAWLQALHTSGSACEATGWMPCFLTLHDGAGLAGAAALYLKAHSYGEFVFDWSWADAYRRHGLRYYPKLLGASPFTPVPGSRLLARDASSRAALARAITALALQRGLSSAHVLYADEADREALAAAGWMQRDGIQFHWQRSPDETDFESYLARLQRHKRKNIVQERRRVAEAGVSFEALEGEAIGAADWDFFHRCYTATYHAHGHEPYLTRELFDAIGQRMARHWLMFVAWRAGRRVAASLIGIDRARGTAWGRYWGSIEPIACLHFEACYYQPLAWCMAHAMDRFEGGAQGEHKMARGLLPVATHSMHWLRDARFADAVADFLRREGAGVEAYADELRERNPFKAA